MFHCCYKVITSINKYTTSEETQMQHFAHSSPQFRLSLIEWKQSIKNKMLHKIFCTRHIQYFFQYVQSSSSNCTLKCAEMCYPKRMCTCFYLENDVSAFYNHKCLTKTFDYLLLPFHLVPRHSFGLLDVNVVSFHLLQQGCLHEKLIKKTQWLYLAG